MGPVDNEKEEKIADTIRANGPLSSYRRNMRSLSSCLWTLRTALSQLLPKKYFDLYDSQEIELPPLFEDDLEDLPEKIQKVRATVNASTLTGLFP